jgi:hypothetical protein
MNHYMIAFPLLAAVLAAQSDKDHPTGPRITPPTLNVVTPQGVARGTTVELTVEGLNLARASAIYFSEPGLTGKILRVKELPDLPDIRLGANGTPSTIDVGPLPPRNQVTVEVDVDPDAAVGPVSFRLLTPLGTSPEGRFLVEPYYGESGDREPNETPETAVETFLPAVLAGTVGRPGDVDYFKITVTAGDQLVFDNGGAQLGSSLQPLVAVIDEHNNLLAEYGREGGTSGQQFAHRFEKAGVYYLRVTDYEQGGRGSAFYRYKLGRFPLVTSAWPLGVREGGAAQVRLAGFNLPSEPVTVTGKASPEDESSVLLRPQGKGGTAFNRVRLALDPEPEVEAQPGALLAWPVTVNGRLGEPGARQEFRFAARKGQPVVIEVNARRLGSELDSVVEVLTAEGKPVERAAARAVWETFTVLAERDSANRGIRIQNWNGLAVGDYVMIGREILRLEALPKTPDDDAIFEAFGGQRLAFFGTSTEAHGVDKQVYKVQMHGPGAMFAPNGLPLARFPWRNDDGGPGYGKDSYLVFEPPADGEYRLRLSDISGGGGSEHTYRLTLRAPRPDFRLSVSPRNPNVPAGGAVPVTVTAQRLDGFEGPIEVAIEPLPAGLKATRGVIAAGQVSATVLLSAAPDARLEAAAPFVVTGKANNLARVANPEDRLRFIAVAPGADIRLLTETREVTLEPGSTAEVFVKLERQNGFGGRVPVEVRNLPPRVRVLDVGLNGVLLNEDETRRSFVLEALASAEPVEQWIYLSGAVETRSPQQNSFASEIPVLVKVKARATLASGAAR